MAIPGLRVSFDVRAKVRIGEKRRSSGGKEYPAAVDYFICDDPEFAQLCGDKPKSIRILFPFSDPSDCFSTGLEWWIKKRDAEKPTLGCYTKDSGDDPIALRLDKLVNPDDVVRGKPKKEGGRIPVSCRARECPIFMRGDCKPMGRLQFFLVGGRQDSVYQLDTKSWNTIEALEGVMSTVGDPRGREFELSVSMVQKGRDRYPVLSLAPVMPAETEVPVQVNNDADIAKADAMIRLAKHVESSVEEGGDARLRLVLAETLDLLKPGWRDDERYVARIRELGVREASLKLIDAIDKGKV